MKFSTLTNLAKFQLSTKVLLSILAVSFCLGASDRASAITDSPIPGSAIPSTTTIPTNAPTILVVPTSTCANVQVKIDNRTPDTVKVTKFEYYDTTQNIFIEKNLLGASGVKQLLSGTNHQATQNFALIDDRNTRFRVTYRHKQGPNNFAAPVEETSGNFRCIDGSTHAVILNK